MLYFEKPKEDQGERLGWGISFWDCGEKLILNCPELLNSDRKSILKFSQQFAKQFEQPNVKGFKPKAAKVKSVFFGGKKTQGKNTRLYFRKYFLKKSGRDKGKNLNSIKSLIERNY